MTKDIFLEPMDAYGITVWLVNAVDHLKEIMSANCSLRVLIVYIRD